MHKSKRFHKCCRTFLLWLSLCCVAAQLQTRGADDVSTQYRVSIYPSYPIKGPLSGGGEFTYAANPDRNSDRFYFGVPQLNLKLDEWVEINGGLRTIYTDNLATSDTLELRPWFGAKLNILNPWKWHIYNYARFEYRDTLTLDNDSWSDTYRIRSRFGVECPLTERERAWKTKTWYALADIEPAYRFDEHTIDPVRVRGGIGYIAGKRLRLEFIYGAQFSRSSQGALQYVGNGLRLNIRMAFADDLL